MPYYVMPNIDELKKFMDEVKACAGSKRQKEVADVVTEQFKKLVEHAKEATAELNAPDTEDYSGHWGMMG